MKLITHHVNTLANGRPELVDRRGDSYISAYHDEEVDEFTFSPTDLDEFNGLKSFDFFANRHPVFAPSYAGTSRWNAAPLYAANFDAAAVPQADFSECDLSFWPEDKFKTHPPASDLDDQSLGVFSDWFAEPHLTSLEKNHRFDFARYLLSLAKIQSHPDGNDLQRICIEGDLDLTAFPILTGLPSYLHVMGNLHLSKMSELKSLPAHLRVEGDLFANECPKLTHVLGDIFVGGNMSLSNCKNLQVLENIVVVKNLDLCFCENILVLPKSVKFGVDLTMLGCRQLKTIEADFDGVRFVDLCQCISLQSLPATLRLFGSLLMTGCCEITALAEVLDIGESLVLKDCTKLSALTHPKKTSSLGLSSSALGGEQNVTQVTVGKTLDLTNCSMLKHLPEGLTVLGNLIMTRCSSLRDLPENLVVAGSIDTFLCGSLQGSLSLPGQYHGKTLLKMLAPNDTTRSFSIENQIFSQEVDHYLDKCSPYTLNKIRNAWLIFERPIQLTESNFIECLKICASVDLREQSGFFGLISNLPKQYKLNQVDWIANISALLVRKSIAGQEELLDSCNGPFSILDMKRNIPLSRTSHSDISKIKKTVGISETLSLPVELELAAQNFWRLRLAWENSHFNVELDDLQDFLGAEIMTAFSSETRNIVANAQALDHLIAASELLSVLRMTNKQIFYYAEGIKIPLTPFLGLVWSYLNRAIKRDIKEEDEFSVTSKYDILLALAESAFTKNGEVRCSPEFLGRLLQVLSKGNVDVRCDLAKGNQEMIRREKRLGLQKKSLSKGSLKSKSREFGNKS